MKVSYNWLNNYVDKKLPSVSDVADALTFHAFEIDGVEDVAGDKVLDVKVTPNRGHDCLGHRGIASELSAILKLPLNQQNDPFSKKPDLVKKTEEIQVYIEDSVSKKKLCKRYIAGHIKNVKVGPSPDWLKMSLEAIGQKSINNIVDATNMVMFNIGQPLHAFDAAKVGKDEGKYLIEVRDALTHEVVEDLTGKEYMLEPGNLVIGTYNEDHQPSFLGIAGVKGGKAAGITPETKEIIIESANFDGVSVRKTAAALKLRTDASSRFEQELSPELAAYGMQQVVDLILHIAGGELAGFVDVYPEPQQPIYASITVEKVNQVLGTQLTGADIADVFQRLGFAYKEEDGVFEVQAPFQRLDISIAEDLVEEVGRIVGYDRVPAVPLPPAAQKPAVNETFYAAEKARQELTAQGYSEVLTSVFANQGERAVANKIGGEQPYLRSSLLPGLSDALKKNIPNKDLLGLKEVKLFEIGSVWKGGKELTMVGIVSEKGKPEEKELEAMSAESYDELPTSQTERYRSFSKYPYIVRDIAMWTPMGTNADDVLNAIRKESGELCQVVRLFDSFEKAERVSLAYRIIFQSFERTLTETEVNAVMERVAESLKAKGFEIR
jgi:phenylalanyl-tRNA synthetase beta chain